MFRDGLVGICIVPVFMVERHIFRFDLVDRLGKTTQLQAWTGP